MRHHGTVLGCLTLILSLAACGGSDVASGTAHAKSDAPKGPTEVALLAGGCFWCTEGAFDDVPGVVEAISGYTGGDQPSPTYEASVCGRHRAFRVDRSALRPVEDQLCPNPEHLLATDRSDRRRRAVRRPGLAVPRGDLRSQRGTAADRRGVETGARSDAVVRQADRDDDPPRGSVLSRRGVSPGLSRQEPREVQGLQVGVRARPLPRSCLEGQARDRDRRRRPRRVSSSPATRSCGAGSPRCSTK